jgi:prolyl-tRNA synthetase
LVVGRRWADGVVELRDRFTGETAELAPAEAVDAVRAKAHGRQAASGGG